MTENLSPLNSSSFISPSLEPRVTTVVLSVSIVWLFDTSVSESMQRLFFCDWLISLAIRSLRFIHVVQHGRISFLWLNNIPRFLYATFSSSVHLLKDHLFIFVRSFVGVATAPFLCSQWSPGLQTPLVSGHSTSPVRNHFLGQPSEELLCSRHAPHFISPRGSSCSQNVLFHYWMGAGLGEEQM